MKENLTEDYFNESVKEFKKFKEDKSPYTIALAINKAIRVYER
jgi:hypothetical protein